MKYKKFATYDEEFEAMKKRLSRMVKINKKINLNNVPKHVAFIMDGNGRWAKRRGMPRNFGHRVGYRAVMLVLKRCVDLGIDVVSIYAFSTENWKRPEEEREEIFRIIRDNIHRDLDEFMNLGVRVVTSGDITAFPADLQEKLLEVKEKTKDNDKCILNMCINYGGRADLVNAMNKLLEQKVDRIGEQDITKSLYTSDLPDPDLIIRTSGEQRVSNFMLWQMAYSEFLFIKPHWPQMDEKLVDYCILEYQKRDRRYGAVKT